MAAEDIVLTHIDQCALTLLGEVNDAGEIVADLRPSAIVSEAGALLASGNLAGLDDTDAALDNLGGTTVGKGVFTAEDMVAARDAIGVTNLVPLAFYIPDILSASAVVVSLVAPCDGIIAGADLWASNTIAAGSLTATLAIGGVAVADGAMTLLATAPSGTIGACTPSASNEVIGRQSVIRVTIGGGNTATGRGTVTLYIQPQAVA